MKSEAVKAVVLAVSLFVAGAAPRAQTTAQKALTKTQVDDLVSSGLESQRIVKTVQERGIDFEPTNEYLEELRSKGANQAVLEALREANPIPLLQQLCPTQFAGLSQIAARPIG